MGGGAKYSQARDILIELSEKHDIPLVETQAGKGTVEADFKNNLGGLGITGTLAANKAARTGRSNHRNRYKIYRLCHLIENRFRF